MDDDFDYLSAEETPPQSPHLSDPSEMMDAEEVEKPTIPDNLSDSSWEAESVSKTSRKSTRPKAPPRPHFLDEGRSGPIRKRGVRCMECPACMRKDDCGRCEMCKDKKKFGGPGIKKQACM